MITICINGNSGSGKTTLSSMILDEENKKVVHLDHLLDKLKRILPKRNVENLMREDEGDVPYLNKNTLFYKTIHNSHLISLYNNIRTLYIRRELKKIYNKSVNAGVEYFIVEGCNSDGYEDLFCYDFKIFIDTFPDVRKERILKRDKNNFTDISSSMFDKVKDDIESVMLYDFVIDNSGTIDELKEKAFNLTSSIIGRNNLKR